MRAHRYYDEEEPEFHRFSTRGHGYPLSNDRDLPPGPFHMTYDNHRTFHSSPYETRSNDNPSDQDPNSKPRSRVPVACGRCRKRKIRCSGDIGGTCTNCKSAGNEQCQFLRVLSTEAPFKTDSSVPEFFDPGAAASRIQGHMVSQAPQYPTMHSPSAVNYDSYQYRNNSLSAYQHQQYPSKQYYSGVSTFAEYDENIDYGLQTSPYQIMEPEHLQPVSPNSNYGTSGPARGWTPAPQLPKSNNTLFIEQEQPLYNHGQLSYNTTGSFPLRTSLAPEPKGMSLGGMGILPTPISSNDRILPNPAANRPGQIGNFLRNNDGLMSMAHPTYQSYGNYVASNMMNGGKPLNHNVVSENAYNIPMSSTSPDSITSSHAYTGSENSVALSQHQNEIYSSNEGLHYHTSEVSESSYGHSNSSRRESQSSRTTHNEGSLPSLSEGDLSNGQHYVPYHNNTSNYPTPPMNIPPPVPIHPPYPIQPTQ